LFKNKLIISRNEAYLTAEAQRTQRPRREEKRKRGFPSLLFSLRGLCVLCASAVNLNWIPELLAQSDQFIFEHTRRYSAERQQAAGRAVKPLADARCYAIGMSEKLYIKLVTQSLLFLIVMGALLFLPAGTFDYWEAWAFIAVFVACNLPLTIWVAINDPRLLERRMRAGPTAEKEKAQKIIVTILLLSLAVAVLIPAFDHRFGWSDVPTSVVILGDALIAISYIGFYFVLRENTYGAATVRVEENQKVISTGPYAIVRHPMYAAALILMLGIPLALGSWWGLLALVPGLPALVWRILDEEKLLKRDLPGYAEYTHRMRFRLIPGLF
jgi:protein-S-isoprenylcysteine O-methyltransferase Ste14